MDDNLFRELEGSLRQAVAIEKGELAPSRVSVVEACDSGDAEQSDLEPSNEG